MTCFDNSNKCCDNAALHSECVSYPSIIHTAKYIPIFDISNCILSSNMSYLIRCYTNNNTLCRKIPRDKETVKTSTRQPITIIIY